MFLFTSVLKYVLQFFSLREYATEIFILFFKSSLAMKQVWRVLNELNFSAAQCLLRPKPLQE